MNACRVCEKWSGACLESEPRKDYLDWQQNAPSEGVRKS